MNVKIKEEEQLVELAARAIYLLSNSRAFTKDMEYGRSIQMLYKDISVEMWELRIDQFLHQIGATEYHSLQELIDGLKSKTIIHDTSPKV